jgi:peptidylprolyl isomerase
MIWTKWYFFLIIFSCLSYCHSEEQKKQSPKQHQSQVSEDLAHLFWHIMTTYEGEYNLEEVLANLKELSTGNLKVKLLTDCYVSLMESMEKKAEEKGLLNLQAAKSYLQKVSNMNDIHELIEGKLYYRIVIAGVGEKISVDKTPLISFKEKTLNGEILSENISGVRIPLADMIQGLRKGLEGMKIGEKREIFIHPDFAYGEFPKPEPYSLIIVEVSIIAL